MARLIAKALAAVLLLVVATASAHKPSDSYLRLNVPVAGAIEGQWDIALRDLDFAIGLDANGDGDITWGEVRARHSDIAAYALARLKVSADDQVCKAVAGEQLIDEHSDGAYTVLKFRLECATTPRQLVIAYSLFADIDPQHRGLLNLSTRRSTPDNAKDGTRTAVLSAQAGNASFELSVAAKSEQFLSFVVEGMWHIWMGFDHILFLISLLLPAVLMLPKTQPWRGPRWLAVPRFKPAVVEVVKIVTAFTLAHSITLTLATLQVVALPSALVESTIAASVVLAALNNVWPFFQGKRWMVAFGFGLIHGFGFASVLADLGLPQDALLLALVAFNVGVEVGQLAIVSVFLPLAYALRRTRFYRTAVFKGGSCLIALLAAVWFVERAFAIEILKL